MGAWEGPGSQPHRMPAWSLPTPPPAHTDAGPAHLQTRAALGTLGLSSQIALAWFCPRRTVAGVSSVLQLSCFVCAQSSQTRVDGGAQDARPGFWGRWACAPRGRRMPQRRLDCSGENSLGELVCVALCPPDACAVGGVAVTRMRRGVPPCSSLLTLF